MSEYEIFIEDFVEALDRHSIPGAFVMALRRLRTRLDRQPFEYGLDQDFSMGGRA